MWLFFFPPGKSGKTMAIENKWSRQCLLPSKDPTADEVEIAWCGLLVFLCRFLWGRFFSLFLEYTNRKKYCGDCASQAATSLFSHAADNYLRSYKMPFTAAVTPQEATRGRRFPALWSSRFALPGFPPTPGGAKKKFSVFCSVMGLLGPADMGSQKMESILSRYPVLSGCSGKPFSSPPAVLLCPSAAFAFAVSRPDQTRCSYVAYSTNVQYLSGHGR